MSINGDEYDDLMKKLREDTIKMNGKCIYYPPRQGILITEHLGGGSTTQIIGRPNDWVCPWCDEGFEAH